MTISPAQCRAARALIAWSQDQLAEASRVATATIATFETGKRVPYPRTIDDIREALENAGIVFIDKNGDGPGVRLRKDVYEAEVAVRAGAALRALKKE
ncbi:MULTISPECIES: transcriptional regulator [unclassified Mesorhizobium]|uniref:helix-turn-helix domain-containing protein n=1 Tax=unclassified Mesorhizobium TaxID=325217 RepID=UPI0032B02260